jgi:hypothetical protein
MPGNRPMSDDIIALLERLSEREVRLQEIITGYQTELSNVQGTIANLRNLRRGAGGKGVRTRIIIESYISKLKPGERIKPASVLHYVDNECPLIWATRAADRESAISQGMAHMVADGNPHIRKESHGAYYKPNRQETES